MKKIINIISILFVVVGQVSAQGLLTVDEAVQIALENNYDIKLSQNNLLIAQENVTYGNAGMLPNVTGNFTQNNSIQNSSQVQQSGEVRALDNAKNNSMNYGVSIGWTIFDGLGMFSRYETLQELEKLGKVEVQRMILQRVSDVIATYYTIVEQQNLLSALDSTILISEERLRTAQNRYEIGKASRLEVLNVQVNLNEDESAKLKQEEVVRNLKTSLNSLMARNLSEDFSVISEVEINQDMKLIDLIEDAKKQNPDLLAVSISKRVAELEVKNVKAMRYPTVRLNTGYNFAESESSLGFVSSSNSRGLTYGVTASVNIFDGFNQRRNERIAKLRVNNADIAIQQQQLQVETAITQAFQTYQTNLALSRLEEKNEQIARQNLNITMDKFRIGTISTVEFRDAQENFINAITRNNSAKLLAKLSEALLNELVGKVNLEN